jgi:hypothetical protein
MKNIPSFDAFINESEEINEASNNFVYISDKKFKSVEDIMASFKKNAGPAWEKFLSDKLGIKVKARTSDFKGRSSVIIDTLPIDKKELGVFGFALGAV